MVNLLSRADGESGAMALIRRVDLAACWEFYQPSGLDGKFGEGRTVPVGSSTSRVDSTANLAKRGRFCWELC